MPTFCVAMAADRTPSEAGDWNPWIAIPGLGNRRIVSRHALNSEKRAIFFLPRLPEPAQIEGVAISGLFRGTCAGIAGQFYLSGKRYWYPTLNVPPARLAGWPWELEEWGFFVRCCSQCETTGNLRKTVNRI